MRRGPWVLSCSIALLPLSGAIRNTVFAGNMSQTVNQKGLFAHAEITKSNQSEKLSKAKDDENIEASEAFEGSGNSSSSYSWDYCRQVWDDKVMMGDHFPPEEGVKNQATWRPTVWCRDEQRGGKKACRCKYYLDCTSSMPDKWTTEVHDVGGEDRCFIQKSSTAPVTIHDRARNPYAAAVFDEDNLTLACDEIPGPVCKDMCSMGVLPDLKPSDKCRDNEKGGVPFCHCTGDNVVEHCESDDEGWTCHGDEERCGCVKTETIQQVAAEKTRAKARGQVEQFGPAGFEVLAALKANGWGAFYRDEAMRRFLP